MADELIENIKKTVLAFQQQMQETMPALEAEVNQLMASGTKDQNTIERNLDTLLSLTQMGIAEALFVKLLEYYKTIDAEGAAFYWNEFDGGEIEN